MTIIVATREFIAADSRLTDGEKTVTVGKIFKRKGGGLFASAGDSRRTHHFDHALRDGKEPSALEVLENEDFEAVLLKADKSLVFYDSNFASFPVGENTLTLGCAAKVARSWLLNGADPITAIRRAIEVDPGCGWPITVAYLDGRVDVIDENGDVEHVNLKRKKGKT